MLETLPLCQEPMADDQFHLIDSIGCQVMGSSRIVGAQSPEFTGAHSFESSLSLPEPPALASQLPGELLPLDFKDCLQDNVLDELSFCPPPWSDSDTLSWSPPSNVCTSSTPGSEFTLGADTPPHRAPPGKPQDLAARLRALVQSKHASQQHSADTRNSVPGAILKTRHGDISKTVTTTLGKRGLAHLDSHQYVQKKVEGSGSRGREEGMAEEHVAAGVAGGFGAERGSTAGMGLSFGSGISICIPFATTENAQPGLPKSWPLSTIRPRTEAGVVPLGAAELNPHMWENRKMIGEARQGAGQSFLLGPSFGQSVPRSLCPDLLPLWGDFECRDGTREGAEPEQWTVAQCGRLSRQVAAQGETRMDAASLLLQSRLLALAEAIAAKDMVLARFVALLLREEASVAGTPMQRLAACLLGGLQTRMAGTPFESPLEKVALKDLSASLADFVVRTPYIPVMSQASVELILESVAGEPAVHIVDCGCWAWTGIWLAFVRRWAWQVRAKAQKAQLRLTIVKMKTDSTFSLNTAGVGTDLTRMAGALGIDFSIQFVVMPTKRFQPELLDLDPREALAVCCFMQLGQLPDGSLLPSNPRDSILQTLLGMQPRVVVITESDMDIDVHVLVPRLKEITQLYFGVFEVLDSAYPRDCPRRQLFEQRILADDLVNALACEGKDMWLLTERLEKWQTRMGRAGFTQRVPSGETMGRLEKMLGQYTRGFHLSAGRGAVELLWKGQPSLFTTAWQPWA